MASNIFEIIGELTNRKSEDTLSFIMRFSKKRLCNKNDVVVHEGASSTTVFIVLSGILEVYRTDILGDTITIAKLEEGDIFGEMGIFLNSKRSASVKALSDVVLAEFSNANFVKALMEIPDMMYRLFRSFAQNLSKMNDKLSHVSELLVIRSIGIHLIEKHNPNLKIPTAMTLNIPEFSKEINFPYEHTFSAFQYLKKLSVIDNFKVLPQSHISFTIDAKKLRKLITSNTEDE